MNKILIIIFVTTASIFADAVYTKNRKANRLYSNGKFQEAFKLYDEAATESPDNRKLKMNKGSALYKLNDFENAEKSYQSALAIEDKKAKADLYYNIGNTYFKQGEAAAQSDPSQVQEKLKKARDSYINCLDINPDDRDAKWNLEIVQHILKQLENQQNKQNQKDQKDNKDQQDKNDQQNQQNKQQKNQQDKKGQDNKDQKNQQDQKDENNQQQQQDQQNKSQESDKDQNPEPQPSQTKEQEMKKQEAERLLQQYADDAEDLNKPTKKMLLLQEKKSDKDW